MLIEVRGGASRRFSAPQRPICLSPSQLALRRGSWTMRLLLWRGWSAGPGVAQDGAKERDDFVATPRPSVLALRAICKHNAHSCGDTNRPLTCTAAGSNGLLRAAGAGSGACTPRKTGGGWTWRAADLGRWVADSKSVFILVRPAAPVQIDSDHQPVWSTSGRMWLGRSRKTIGNLCK